MTNLSEKMMAKADDDNLPDDHGLRISALAFNEATEGFYGNPQTVDIKKFMGSWARARRIWCDYTGESLI